MKEDRYKTFSLRTHKKNWRTQRLNVCQFEATFGCGLHCRHCNTDCYNRPAYLKKELTTAEVKFILDKVYQTGIIWLCFTGGDPLIRRDFLDIYAYAKDKGFIITIFTSAYYMTHEIAGFFKKNPPFVIEITLNAVTEEPYERISQVKGSFKKVMEGIGLILKAKIQLKIKTQITQDNLGQIPQVKKFIEGLGVKFQPSYDLYARLNNDLAPCNLRVVPDEVLTSRITSHPPRRLAYTNLFNCAVDGGDSVYIDPYGNAIACALIREPAFNLLKVDVGYAMDRLLASTRNRKFVTDSKCNGCNLRGICGWCPGRAYVERGDMEAPIDYYCRLAHQISG